MKFEFQLDGELAGIEIEPVESGQYRVRLGERELLVLVPHLDPGYVVMQLEGIPYRAQIAATRAAHHVAIGGEFYDFWIPKDEPRARRGGRAGAPPGGRVSSPMPGKVTKILVEMGATVAAGDGLLILEAMKMENEIRAPAAGVVKTICVTAGQMVMPAETLVEIESGPEGSG